MMPDNPFSELAPLTGLVRVYRDYACGFWMANYVGTNAAEPCQRVFGTTVITLPFSNGFSLQTIVQDFARRHPQVKVEKLPDINDERSQR
jgi:hypothetical protein